MINQYRNYLFVDLDNKNLIHFDSFNKIIPENLDNILNKFKMEAQKILNNSIEINNFQNLIYNPNIEQNEICLNLLKFFNLFLKMKF